MQKLLIAANKFPQKESLKLFCKKSEDLQKSTIECKRAIKKQIKELQSVQNTMFKISETKIELEPLETEKASTQEIWNTLESNF